MSIAYRSNSQEEVHRFHFSSGASPALHIWLSPQAEIYLAYKIQLQKDVGSDFHTHGVGGQYIGVSIHLSLVFPNLAFWFWILICINIPDQGLNLIKSDLALVLQQEHFRILLLTLLVIKDIQRFPPISLRSTQTVRYLLTPILEKHIAKVIAINCIQSWGQVETFVGSKAIWIHYWLYFQCLMYNP